MTYEAGASFSVCRTWRYSLWRRWGSREKFCVFIGLNPSTADETRNDPTVRRCIGFARDWGYDGLYMLNIFAYRETNAALAMAYPEPVGPRNNQHLLRYMRAGSLIVAAWGAQPGIEQRTRRVGQLAKRAGVKLHCLGTTKAGHPRHPLYIKADTRPVLFAPA